MYSKKLVMKKLMFLFTCVALLVQLSAQNPFKELGIKDSDYLTLSDGRYDEFHEYNDFERVGSAIIDMRTNKIARFIDRDSVIGEGMAELDMTTRFLTIDPMAEKYFQMSPYAYCANNPIRYIDPTGMDWYEFDKDGNYKKKTEMDGTNRIMIHTVEKTKEGYEYDSYKFVDFADPENDAKDIDDGTINKLVSVSEEDMQSMMEGQGAFESGKLNFGWESQGGGDFDYSFTILPEKYTDANFDPTTMKSNSLFLPEGDNTAHNFMNFGNYLWGATGYSVGFGYGELQSGAHTNSILNSRRNGYPAQWDSKDDQRSLIKGAYHAQLHNYRKLRK